MHPTWNYYEALQVAQTAGMNEIEEAYRREYNKWSKLINHHDPDMQDNARKNLRLIENAKTTLLDAAKRSEHDRALVSGLYDESAKPNPAAATMPVITSPPPQKSSQKDISTNGWECSRPNCQMVNPIGTMYCESCGERLAKGCPRCGHRITIQAKFCGICGVNFEEFEIELQQQAAQREIEKQQRIKNQRTQAKFAKEEFFLQLHSIPKHRHRKIIEVLESSQYSATAEANQVRAMARRHRTQMVFILGIGCPIVFFGGGGMLLSYPTISLTDTNIALGLILIVGGAISGYLWCGKKGGELGIAVDLILATIYSFLTVPYIFISWIAIKISLEDQKPYNDVAITHEYRPDTG